MMFVHFIREELRRWFIQQEVDMFRYRLYRIANDSALIEKFLKDNDLVYVPVIKRDYFNHLKHQIINKSTIFR